MVASSSLQSSAPRSVDAGGEHMIVAGVFGGGRCGMNVGGQCKGGCCSWAWLSVAVGLAAWSPALLVRGTILKPVRVHLWPQMMVRPR
jgi:hypothetical protein